MNADFERLEDKVDRIATAVEKLAVHSLRLDIVEKEQASAREERMKMRADLDKWVNRGWGAWGVVVVVFTLITSYDWVKAPPPATPPAYHYQQHQSEPVPTSP